MSLFRRPQATQKRFFGITGAGDLVPARSAGRIGRYTVTSDTALRHSAVWACLRLRASLISTFPVDVFRRIGDLQIEMPKPPVLTQPGGERVGLMEWLYSSQVDLDRSGNAIGLIVERNALGLPAQVELQPIGECSVRMEKGRLKYRVAGKSYDPPEVWHEKQYTVSGLPFGLSPVSYAAWSISEYLSIQQFALDWFGGGATPNARLRNTARIVEPGEALTIKERWRASVAAGEPFVTGSDWEYDMMQAQSQDMAWLNAQQHGLTDISRFLDCPADLIDAAVSGSSVTYASMTQRNLQFLILQLGPAIIRREDALSRMLPRPRYVKFNTDALLRMDPKTRAEMFQTLVAARVLAPSEARELDNRPPFTAEQLAEFKELFPVKGTSAGGGAAGGGAADGASSLEPAALSLPGM